MSYDATSANLESTSPPPKRSRRRLVAMCVAVAVVWVVAAGAAGILVGHPEVAGVAEMGALSPSPSPHLSPSPDPSPSPSPHPSSSPNPTQSPGPPPLSLRLQLSTALPAGAFSAATDSAPQVFAGAAALAADQALTKWKVAAATGVRQAVGTDAGLYAGSLTASPCVAATLATDLRKTAAVAAAWAKAAGISADQISRYLTTMTPAYLGHDTVVSLSTVSAGVPFLTVLQAGTAVLVDATGIPRVRCAGGFPLSVPASGAYRRATLVGVPWDGFAVANVVAVRPGTAAAQFTFLNATTGRPYLQPVGPTPVPTPTPRSPDPTVTTPSPTPPPRETMTVTVTPTPTAPANPDNGSGDLGLSVPVTQPPCDGLGIVIVASLYDPDHYARDVQQKLDESPGSLYLLTEKSCSSLIPTKNGNPIYAVYYPVGYDKSAVCAKKAEVGGSPRWLDNTSPAGVNITC